LFFAKKETPGSWSSSASNPQAGDMRRINTFRKVLPLWGRGLPRFIPRKKASSEQHRNCPFENLFYPVSCRPSAAVNHQPIAHMKSNDAKKESKKKPLLTLKEKRLAKQEKKKNK
jgi:hypothetical protein